MASTEIYVKRSGGRKWERIGCASQAMCGAIKFWLEMEKKYLHPLLYTNTTRLIPLNEAQKEVWEIPQNKNCPMPMDERFVFFTTFDRTMVASKDVPSLIEALRSVGERYNTNHTEQADIIEAFYNENKDKKFHIAWNQTSICYQCDKFGKNMDAPLKNFISVSIERIEKEFIK